MRGRVIAGVLAALTVGGCAARMQDGRAEPTQPQTEDGARVAAVSPEWEAVFNRTDGWTGGDGLGTVELPGHRMLWLMGDSWIGPVREGKHAAGSNMVNNAIVVTPIFAGGRAPLPEDARFLWGKAGSDGKPTAWIVPPAEECAAEKNLRYWPAPGAVLTPVADGRSRLYVFLARVRDRGVEGVWNFEGCGSAVAWVENPESLLGDWRVRQATLTRMPAPIPPGMRRVQWGASAILAEERAEGVRKIYVLGVDTTDGFNKQLLLARTPAESVERFENWEFRTADGWSRNADDAEAIADHVMDEFSISRIVRDGKPVFLMVYSKPILDDKIVARTAARLEGPWSAAREIYRCPEPRTDKRLFVYSAKAHPEVSPPGELLISYCVNSNDFWHMAAHAEIYRPRFVRVPIEACFSK